MQSAVREEINALTISQKLDELSNQIAGFNARPAKVGKAASAPVATAPVPVPAPVQALVQADTPAASQPATAPASSPVVFAVAPPQSAAAPAAKAKAPAGYATMPAFIKKCWSADHIRQKFKDAFARHGHQQTLASALASATSPAEEAEAVLKCAKELKHIKKLDSDLNDIRKQEIARLETQASTTLSHE